MTLVDRSNSISSIMLISLNGWHSKKNPLKVISQISLRFPKLITVSLDKRVSNYCIFVRFGHIATCKVVRSFY